MYWLSKLVNLDFLSFEMNEDKINFWEYTYMLVQALCHSNLW